MTSPINTQWIEVPCEAGSFGAFLALPPAGRGPGLVLFQEIFGVNEHIRQVAEQYALAGFVVLAPDVFWQQQRRVELGYDGADWLKARSLKAGTQVDTLVRDIQASVAALRARPEVNGARVGALGYCMGGWLAYLAAAHAGVNAAVAYYGGGIQNHMAAAAHITCPVMFHYARIDEHIPPEAVDTVRSAMAGKGSHLYVYEAEHGFNCWARKNYHPRSAAAALGRTLTFLAAELFQR
jgi:carboxymethylenebutenolidase